MGQNRLACTILIGRSTRADDSSAQGVTVKSNAPELQPAQCTLHFSRQDGGMRNDMIKGRINPTAGRQEGEVDGAASLSQNVAFCCQEIALSETDERRGPQREEKKRG